MKKRITLFLLLIVSLSYPACVFGESSRTGLSPLYQYNYNWYGEQVLSPPAYLTDTWISGESLGVSQFNNPADVFCTDNGMIYIVDSGNNRIVICDEEYKFHRMINRMLDYDGEGSNKFNGPKGIFVLEDGTIYLCDTGNNRILQMDSEGRYISEIYMPDNDLIKEGKNFKPISVGADKWGNLYVNVSEFYEGLMEFDERHEFKGFLGANKVTYGLWDLFWKRVLTAEQASKMEQFIPIEYSNIDMDDQGFIYATVNTKKYFYPEKIKRMNATGRDVLLKTVNTAPVGDLMPANVGDPPITKTTLLGDIAIWENQAVYSALDVSMGRIFTYDLEGNLLFIFGNLGEGAGQFKNPVAIAEQNRNLLVLDAASNRLILCKPTGYASNIISALEEYTNGNYAAAKNYWHQVIKNNVNIEIGYTGLARCSLREKDYKNAVYYARLANSKGHYNMAFEKYRQAFIREHFGFFFAAAVALILLVVFWIVRKSAANKKEKQVNRSFFGTLNYGFHIMRHPFDGFWDMTHEERGSIHAAMAIYSAFIAVNLCKIQYTGFLFNNNDLRSVNILREIAIIVGFLVIWNISNHSISAWIYGEASMKHIVMYTAYSLLPYVIFSAINILLSQFILADEAMYYTAFNVIGLLWSTGLLFAGNIVIHQYSVKSCIAHIAGTVMQMAVTLFVGLVSTSLIQQIISFVSTIYHELKFR